MITEEWLRTLLHIEGVSLDFFIPKTLATGMRYILVTPRLEIEEILISTNQETGALIGMCISENKRAYAINDLSSAGLIIHCIRRGRKGRTSQLLMMSKLTVVLDPLKQAQTSPESLPCEEEN